MVHKILLLLFCFAFQQAAFAASQELTQPSEPPVAEPETRQLSRQKSSKSVSAAAVGDASPFTPVKFGEGIEFNLPESRFRMNLRFRMQNLADFNFVENPDPGEPAHDFNWQVRRLRLRMNGTVATPKLQYLIQLSMSRGDQDWDESGFPHVVRDAMIMYQMSPHWRIAFGQAKLPGNRQRVVSSGDQQFVDRSIVNGAFNIDRDFGFQVQWSNNNPDHLLRWQGAITSGMGRNRSVPASNKLFYTTRVEWLPLGAFERNGDYFESDLAYEENLKLSLAWTSAFLDGARRNNGSVGEIFTVTGLLDDQPVERSPWLHSADFLAKWRGHSLYLEWFLRDLNDPFINANQAFLTGQGINAQFGKMIGEDWEIAARYAAVLPRAQVQSLHQERRQWTVGVNRFLEGHRVKLQANVGFTEGIDQFFRLQMELGI